MNKEKSVIFIFKFYKKSPTQFSILIETLIFWDRLFILFLLVCGLV